MKISQGLLEKIIISLLFTVVSYLLNLIIPFLNLIPKLSIVSGTEILIGPNFTVYLLIFIFAYLSISTYLSSRIVYNYNLSKICPQFKYFSKIAVFSSNGFVKFTYNKKGKIFHVEVAMQPFDLTTNHEGFTTSFDCGIIFLRDLDFWPFSKGYRISDKRGISFEIMNKNNGDNLGISFKNIHGYEQKIPLKSLIDSSFEKDNWKLIDIELDKFQFITRSIRDNSYIECFSFFTNSNLLGDKQDKTVSFYLREIQFY